MKASHIDAVLAHASLPRLTREEMHLIAAGADAQRFKTALLAVEGGDLAHRPILQAIIAQVRENASKPAAAAARTLAPYYSFNVFARSAALCVSEAKTRSQDLHTVQIEGAPVIDNGAGRRIADWGSKITVQLSQQECLLMLALFEGEIGQLEFKGHGAVHDKVLSFDMQESHYLVKLVQRNRRPVAVPVEGPDTMNFVALAYRQIQRNAPHLDNATIRAQLARVAAMHQSAASKTQSA